MAVWSVNLHTTKFIKLLVSNSKENILKKNVFPQRTRKKKKKKKKIEKKQINIPSNPRHVKSQLDKSIKFCPSLLRYVLYERPTEFRRYCYINDNSST